MDIGTGNGHFLFRLREPFPSEDGSDSGPEDEGHAGGEGEREWTGKVQRRGFRGRLVGTDYSQKSIEFAHRIAASRVPPVDPPIEFLHYDIMSRPPAPGSPHPLLSAPNASGYDVVLDKGTFDAISLSDERLPSGRPLCEGYRERILRLVKEGGRFVVTSCNWTGEELRGWFEGGGEGDAGEGGDGGEEGGIGGTGDVRDGGEWGFVFETGLKYRSFRFGGREGQSISSVCFRKRRGG